jgi:hypothetical protein
MANKYKSGNTRVLLDLGKLYGPLRAYALEVGISLAAVIRIILNDAIIRGSITLPPIDRGIPTHQESVASEENAEGQVD